MLTDIVLQVGVGSDLVTTSNSSNGSCHKYSKGELQAVQTTEIVIASVGAVSSILAILLIVISRSYRRFVFRLVIYFMSVNIYQCFVDFIKIIPVHHDGDVVAVKKGWESVCAAFGFLEMVDICANEVVIVWIILYLLKLTWKIYSIQTGIDTPDLQGNEPKRSTSFTKPEALGLFLIVFLPIAYCWTPFVKDMYGLSGMWCWIKPTKTDCGHDYTLGLIFMFTVSFVPLLSMVLFVYVGLLIIVVILCKGAFEMRGLARRQYQRGMKEMVIVLILAFLYDLLCALVIALRIYFTVSATRSEPLPHWLWSFYTVVSNVFRLMPPIAFFLHPSTWKNMFCRQKQEDDTYFSVPPEGDDIDEGIKIKQSKPFYSYGSILHSDMIH